VVRKWQRDPNCFRKKRSTVDHLLSLTSIVGNKLKKKAETFAAFIDFQKAYDTFNISIFWSRITEMGLNCKMVLNC